jgi:hypothetical protein
MRRYSPGEFRSLPPDNTNMLDQPALLGPAAVTCSLTPGCTQIDTIDLQGPNQSQHWTFLSVSVQAKLRFRAADVGDVTHFYGRLSKILAGVILDNTSIPTQNGINAYISPMQALPVDSTLLTPLWDPDTDPLPPTVASSIGTDLGLTINASIVLNDPVDIVPGVTPYIGMWMEPSLIGVVISPATALADFAIEVFDAVYTVNYDDGL